MDTKQKPSVGGTSRYFLGLHNVRNYKTSEKKRKLNKILSILYKFDCVPYFAIF